MRNFAVKLNLTQLSNVVREFNGKSGKVKCIVLPIKENHLCQGEKGIYLELTGIALKDPKYPKQQTHLVKQNFEKEVYSQFSEEEKKSLPILGNGIYFSPIEPDAVQSEEIADIEASDDLPF